MPAWAPGPDGLTPDPAARLAELIRRDPTLLDDAGSAALTGGAGCRRLRSGVAQPDLTLTASLRPAALDARRGIVRLHPEVLDRARAAPRRPGPADRPPDDRRASRRVAEPAASRALLYADDLLLGNLGVRDGGQVTVRRRRWARPRRVVLAGPAEIVAAVSPGDAPAGPARQGGHRRRRRVAAAAGRAAGRRGPRRWSRRPGAAWPTRVGYAWTSTLLTVVGPSRTAGALVTMDTVVGWRARRGHPRRATRDGRHRAGAGRRAAPTPARRTAAARASTTCPGCGRRPRS